MMLVLLGCILWLVSLCMCGFRQWLSAKNRKEVVGMEELCLGGICVACSVLADTVLYAVWG